MPRLRLFVLLGFILSLNAIPASSCAPITNCIPDVPEVKPLVVWTPAGPIGVAPGTVVDTVASALNVTYNSIRPAPALPKEVVASGTPKQPLKVDNGSSSGSEVSTQDYGNGDEGGCRDLSFCYNAHTRRTYRGGVNNSRLELQGIWARIVPNDDPAGNFKYDFWYESTNARTKNGWKLIALVNGVRSDGAALIADYEPMGTVQNGSAKTISLGIGVKGASIGKSWQSYSGKIAGSAYDEFKGAQAGWGVTSGSGVDGDWVALRSMAVYEQPRTSDSAFVAYSTAYGWNP